MYFGECDLLLVDAHNVYICRTPILYALRTYVFWNSDSNKLIIYCKQTWQKKSSQNLIRCGMLFLRFNSICACIWFTTIYIRLTYEKPKELLNLIRQLLFHFIFYLLGLFK